MAFIAGLGVQIGDINSAYYLLVIIAMNYKDILLLVVAFIASSWFYYSIYAPITHLSANRRFG